MAHPVYPTPDVPKIFPPCREDEESLPPKPVEQRSKKKKQVIEILGYPNLLETPPNLGKRRKKKGKNATYRSAAATAALSVSISSGAIKNRNRGLLNEAQTVWTVNKLMGLSCNGNEEEVVSKLYEMEVQDAEKAECLPKNNSTGILLPSQIEDHVLEYQWLG